MELFMPTLIIVLTLNLPQRKMKTSQSSLSGYVHVLEAKVAFIYVRVSLSMLYLHRVL